MTRWVLVQCDERVLALPAGAVEELVEVSSCLPAPGVLAAVRGVAPYRGRLAPLVHVGAAVTDGTPPSPVGTTAVAVHAGGRRILLEVEAAADVIAAPETPLPQGWRGQWAAGAVRRPEGLVPVLDLEWLATRLTRSEASATA